MKQFFISFFANLAALFLVLGGPIFLLVILAFASFHNSHTTHRSLTIQRGSILVFDLSVQITDSPDNASPTSPLSAALSNDPNRTVMLRHVLHALRKAAKDDRIKALLLEGSIESTANSGFASLAELRQAIIDFRKTGKRVYAYLETPRTGSYYVASAASDIYLNPFGELDIPGLAVVNPYFANAFQKYGINVQVTRVGKYKSFVEPFILNKMSDADKESTGKLVADLWSEFINAVSVSRHIDPVALQQLVDTDGDILPEHAVAAKLVDKLGYFGDLIKVLARVAPPSSYAADAVPFKQVSIFDYAENLRTPQLVGDHGDLVAILYLEGDIVDGEGALTDIGGDRYAEQLRLLERDKDVKAVVLRVNSPGGSAYASEVIQREVRQLKILKPVIISMGNLAASGGYWISTFGDRIFAEPNTITGSIGVFGILPDISKLADNIGITFDGVKTGKYADSETITRPKTPDELKIAQARVDDLYEKFLDKVSTGRLIPIETMRVIAEGRPWSGSEALKLHLVDEMGGLDQAVAYAAEKANLGSHFKVKEYPEQVDFTEALAQLFNREDQPVSRTKLDPFTRELNSFKTDLKSLQELNDPLNVYARLPIGFQLR